MDKHTVYLTTQSEKAEDRERERERNIYIYILDTFHYTMEDGIHGKTVCTCTRRGDILDRSGKGGTGSLSDRPKRGIVGNETLQQWWE